MACGYLNSAGTDLDSLFLVDNKNSGAIGFLTSSGQDLGNRFSAASTLGYNVGYNWVFKRKTYCANRNFVSFV